MLLRHCFLLVALESNNTVSMSSCMRVTATACCLLVSPHTGRGGRKTAERTGARRSAGGSGAQSGIDPPPPLAADGTSLGRPPRSGGAEEGERKLAFVCVGSVCPPHSVGLPGCLVAPPPPPLTGEFCLPPLFSYSPTAAPAEAEVPCGRGTVRAARHRHTAAPVHPARCAAQGHHLPAAPPLRRLPAATSAKLGAGAEGGERALY